MHFFHHATQNKNNGFRLGGFVLILMGLVVFGVPLFQEVETETSKILLVGSVPILLGIFLISTYSGRLIDFEAKKIKKYQQILWFKVGKWENLPAIEHAELIHYNYQHRNIPNGISPTISTEITIYKCVLRLKGREFMVFDYQNEQEAIAALEVLQNGFKLS